MQRGEKQRKELVAVGTLPFTLVVPAGSFSFTKLNKDLISPGYDSECFCLK